MITSYKMKIGKTALAKGRRTSSAAFSFPSKRFPIISTGKMEARVLSYVCNINVT